MTKERGLRRTGSVAFFAWTFAVDGQASYTTNLGGELRERGRGTFRLRAAW